MELTFARPPPTLARMEWLASHSPVDYQTALDAMETRVAGMGAGTLSEQIWLLEHPPLYTAGTSAKPADLLTDALPVYPSQRGGQYTYHGPGQRIAYVMMDLNTRGRDLRAFVCAMEEWIIRVLARFDVVGERRAGRVGVWVVRRDLPVLADGSWREDKIAAIGLRVRKWVTFHGLSINVDCDLTGYEGIVPCGLTGFGVTSLADLGRVVSVADVDLALRAEFELVFSD